MSTETSFDRFIAKHPEFLFSPYTAKQVEVLRWVGVELREVLDTGFNDTEVEYSAFDRAYGLFWLWVLGAYEVARTMAKSQGVFTPEALSRIRSSREGLAVLRMPFAKQELRDKVGGGPIHGELSVVSISVDRKDLAFAIEGRMYWMREEIANFESVLGGLSVSNVIRSPAGIDPQP